MIKKQFGIFLIGLSLLAVACGNKGTSPKKDSTAAVEETKQANDVSEAETKQGNEVSVAETTQGNDVSDSLTPVSKAKLSLTYSNLVDQESRDRVTTALKNAGLKDEKIKAFFAAVDEYNNAVGKDKLVQKMTTIDKAFPSLDTDKLVDAWVDKGGDVGRNCRITAYDFGAISAKNIFTGEDKKKFDTLFSYIDVTNTKDSKVLAEEIQKSWKEKEISFHNDKMHMISVFMTMDDGKNKVQEFVGHVGVLVQDGDKYLFIEKLAFELPYQVDEFNNLQEVNDYLMGYYDQDADGLSAKPLIFEDDHVLKEYRVVE